MRRIISRAAAAAALSLAFTALLPACAPAVVLGTAAIVNDDLARPESSVVVGYPADQVWASARSTMAHMTDDLLDIDPELRMIKTYVAGALVTVWVERYKTNQTKIRVEAERYAVYSDEVATNVRNSIHRDL